MIKGSKLIVDGKSYTLDEVEKVPAEIKMKKQRPLKSWREKD